MGAAEKSYWNVLYTRPRAEKKAAMELAALGAQVYCPTLEVLSQWSDRKKRIQKPALPSMVLVKEDTPDSLLFLVKILEEEWFIRGKSRVSQVEANQSDFKWGLHCWRFSDSNRKYHCSGVAKKGTIVKIKGNDCWVQLANASITVSFFIVKGKHTKSEISVDPQGRSRGKYGLLAVVKPYILNTIKNDNKR